MYVTKDGVVKEKPLAEKLIVDLGFVVFPRENTCDGENRSPSLTIQGLKTPFIAVVMDSHQGSAGRFANWIMWDIDMRNEIPSNIPKNDEIREPFHAIQGRNSENKPGYSGPCGVRGGDGRYFVKVYGYDFPLSLKSTSNIFDLEEALKDRYSQFGQAMARYARPL